MATQLMVLSIKGGLIAIDAADDPLHGLACLQHDFKARWGQLMEYVAA
jgi:hypothetical protein